MLISLMMLLQSQDPLWNYEWKNRVVLISSSDQDMLDSQLATFHIQQLEMTERDLVIISLLNGKVMVDGIPSEISPIEIKRAFVLGDSNFTLVLIGKDGREKLRSKSLVEPSDIFALIDQMPMRRHELRSKR